MVRWLAFPLVLQGCFLIFPEPESEPESGPVGPPCLQLSREVLDFGPVPVGERTSDVVRLTNDCADGARHAPVRVTEAFFDGDAFWIESASAATVEHGESALFKVVFSPDEAGLVDDTFHLLTDIRAAPDLQIPASGIGTVPTVDLVAERTVATPLLGCADPLAVDVFNAGVAPLVVYRVEVESALPGFDVDYRLDENGDGPWMLGPGEVLPVDIIANPPDLQPVDAVVRVRSDDPYSAQVGLELQAAARPYRDASDVFRYFPPESGDDASRFVLEETAVPATVRVFRDEVPITEGVYSEPDGTAIYVEPNDQLEPDDLMLVTYEVQPDCDDT